MANHRSTRMFYGWWIVVAAFLNLFFAVGIIFYGFPVFYPAFVESLGFTRAQVTQGFLLGFLVAGLPFGFLAGAMIDRIGARLVILSGAGLVGISLLLMGSMTKLWHYELLCVMEVLGYVLVVGAIGAVIQHFILFLNDQGYSTAAASRFSTALLAASLGGRVLVGYIADRFRKKNTMALFYALLSASLLLLGMAHQTIAVWTFALFFGFSMGADYMLIPLVTAECFGTASLGKLLALIIMGYSLGQWGMPWIAGRIFDAQHSYELSWRIMAVAGLLGAV